MNKAKAIELINRSELAGANEQKLVIEICRPGSLGGTPVVGIKDIQSGFDWDSGKLLIIPEQPLTALTREDVDAIHQSAAKGQSWHTYKMLKEKDTRIAELEQKLAELEGKG